ncbi:uncharacterized protein A1O9_01673 [Exophiala aquamarina CBS 119918]|uniref:Uncharacterized protein n=1 Tax=Exophiala aquamarina CBS 119918 TaxID=1182545 RepID=A0A072Q6Y0_9EURO|nr:uncharacterized protein A1O9_01673 [Exophiala aquamarina CBS 119918]KEF63695.1 hypothetical protein A1O9_01673 [Exophiala aquamarina CBS 119918]
MPEDKRCKDTSIPPPLDPFPTYQTPYPRSNHNQHENPFIQFRRFADEKFSSFFQGIPNLFGVPAKDVDDLMRRRHELEEGWKKQFEQEVEEMRHEVEKTRIATLKAMEDSWSRSTEAASKSSETVEPSPWWMRGNPSKCPALNGQEPQPNAHKCPALYDEAGEPKTELDLYEAPTVSKRQPTDTQGVSSSGRPWPHWLTPGDLKAKEKATEQTKQRSEEAPYTPATRYSLGKARHMNPFDNPDHTIPWLMLSPYSPIYLCNPGQARMFRVKIQDAEDVPLQISRPKYFERWYTEVDDKLSRQLSWADAFEDLISLQQRGSMVDRNYSTLRTPPTWIHDMVSRGSLGDRWGFNDDGILMKRSNGNAATETATIKDHCRGQKEQRWRSWRRGEDAQKQPKDDEKEKREDLIDKFVDDLPESIARSPIFGGLLSAADSIVSAVEQGIEDVLKQTQEELATSTDTAAIIESEEPDSTPYSSLANSSSSSSSSYSYASNTSASYSSSSDQDPSSIISTLTTTVTRTLPDGSVETKRVFKKRFADGTEESDESTEVKSAASRATPANPEVSDKQTQTQPASSIEPGNSQVPAPKHLDPEMADRIHNTYGAQVFQRGHDETNPPSNEQAENPQARRRGGGWFWTR